MVGTTVTTFPLGKACPGPLPCLWISLCKRRCLETCWVLPSLAEVTALQQWNILSKRGFILRIQMSYGSSNASWTRWKPAHTQWFPVASLVKSEEQTPLVKLVSVSFWRVFIAEISWPVSNWPSTCFFISILWIGNNSHESDVLVGNSSCTATVGWAPVLQSVALHVPHIPVELGAPTCRLPNHFW